MFSSTQEKGRDGGRGGKGGSGKKRRQQQYVKEQDNPRRHCVLFLFIFVKSFYVLEC